MTGLKRTAPRAFHGSGGSNPTLSTNPPFTPFVYLNTNSGELFTCTDNTIDANAWVGWLGTEITV